LAEKSKFIKAEAKNVPRGRMTSFGNSNKGGGGTRKKRGGVTTKFAEKVDDPGDRRGDKMFWGSKK